MDTSHLVLAALGFLAHLVHHLLSERRHAADRTREALLYLELWRVANLDAPPAGPYPPSQSPGDSHDDFRCS
jgi:hypothetical protein